MKQFLERLVTLQPAVLRGAIVSIVTLLTAVGVFVSPEIPDAIMGVVGTVSALVAALWIRSAVTPNAKVLAYVPDPERPRVIEPGEATTTATSGAILEAVRAVGRHAAPE